jgi:hypothetical protein
MSERLRELRKKKTELISHVLRLEDDYVDPYKRLEIGSNNWDEYARVNRTKLKNIRMDLMLINREIAKIRAEQDSAKSEMIALRMRELAKTGNASLVLLEGAFRLIKSMMQDVVLSLEEISLVDSIGIHLKQQSGLSSNGNPVELSP